jgi:hypothetical protein
VKLVTMNELNSVSIPAVSPCNSRRSRPLIRDVPSFPLCVNLVSASCTPIKALDKVAVYRRDGKVRVNTTPIKYS